MSTISFEGLLYFPLTPFAADGSVNADSYVAHLQERLEHKPGGVFPACGTGELHALSVNESTEIVGLTVDVVDGDIPVVAGVGGSLADAVARAKEAERAGADSLLILPPYLVQGSEAGTIAYVQAIVDACSLPVILYNRGTARYSADSLRSLFSNPQVVGFKDGAGDIAQVQDIVLAAEEAGRDDMLFFNGLLTAELSQSAYRGVGVPLYSSAAFAMIPEVANAYYHSLADGNLERQERLLNDFYRPLVKLRDETPGFGVSLIKAGARLRGEDVGSIRAPLTDPTAEQTDRLSQILDSGRQVLADSPA